MTDAPPATTAAASALDRRGHDLNFRSDIEGLRAVAVILVVLYHAGVHGLSGGFVGVDVFFVISGFLITSLLLKEHENPKYRSISLPNFYARRARRILPAAMLVIILTVFGSYFLQNELEYIPVVSAAKWAAFFSANFHFALVRASYFNPTLVPSPLLHFWSLAVEEQFYVVWPLLIIIVGASLKRFAFRQRVLALAGSVAVASFVWSVIQVSADPQWAYYSPFTRAWELAVGGLAAVLVPQISKIPRATGCAVAFAGLVAIGLAATFYSPATQFPGWAALVPVLGAGAVIAGGGSGLGATPLLGLRPVRSVGRVSYGWYLLHYPPMILLTGAIYLHPLTIFERLVIALVTLGLAYRMEAWIERPVRESKFLIRHSWLSIATGAACVTAAFLVAYLLTPSFHHLWHV